MSAQEQFNKSSSEIYKKISKHVPEIEWKVHAPLIEKINKLKKEKNAVILLIIIKHQKYTMEFLTLQLTRWLLQLKLQKLLLI